MEVILYEKLYQEPVPLRRISELDQPVTHFFFRRYFIYEKHHQESGPLRRVSELDQPITHFFGGNEL